METDKTAFRDNHIAEIRRLADYYRKQLTEDIVPFWQARAVDPEYGGYFNCFDRKGNRCGDMKCGWFVGRDLYTFSSLYRLFGPNEEWKAAAESGRRFLTEKALNPDGRMNRLMKRDGSVLDGETSIFTDHFAVKALFSYIRAFDKKEDIPLAGRLFQTLLQNVSRPEILAAECPDERFRKHALNFMTLIVAMEGKELFRDIARPVIDRCLHDSLYVFAVDSEEAPLEYVAKDGKPLLTGPGRIVDPGHTMESLWFAMLEGLERGDPAPIQRAGRILDWVIDRSWDGEYGGFFQNVDVYQTEPEVPYRSSRYADIDAAWSDKIWWVQAEALNALAMSALLNGSERHFQYFLKQHEFCREFLSDPEYGEWYGILKRDGKILSDRKGFELKGPYHVPRCEMLLTSLFEQYVSGDKEFSTGGYSGKGMDIERKELL